MPKAEERPEDATLRKALTMFAEASKEPKLTLAQVHALLYVASETRVDSRIDRLPTVSDIARATGFSASGASRLMSSLLKDGLVLNERGGMGTRSEAFVLSTLGTERVARLLEVLSGEPISDLGVYSFITFAHARFAPKEASGKLSMVRLEEDTCEFLVAPADDALSEEVRVWCKEKLTAVPEFRVERSGVRVEFKTVTDAVSFKMRWAG